jgi:hypothetical protein
MSELGNAYHHGQGTVVDLAQSAVWHRRVRCMHPPPPPPLPPIVKSVVPLA